MRLDTISPFYRQLCLTPFQVLSLWISLPFSWILKFKAQEYRSDYFIENVEENSWKVRDFSLFLFYDCWCQKFRLYPEFAFFCAIFHFKIVAPVKESWSWHLYAEWNNSILFLDFFTKWNNSILFLAEEAKSNKIRGWKS